MEHFEPKTMIKIQTILLLIALLITLREAFQQRDRVEPNDSIQTVWHIYGWLIRFFVFGLLFMVNATSWVLLLSLILMWPVYNIACNIGMKKKWYYLSDKGIDKYTKKVFNFLYRGVIKSKGIPIQNRGSITKFVEAGLISLYIITLDPAPKEMSWIKGLMTAYFCLSFFFIRPYKLD